MNPEKNGKTPRSGSPLTKLHFTTSLLKGGRPHCSRRGGRRRSTWRSGRSSGRFAGFCRRYRGVLYQYDDLAIPMFHVVPDLYYTLSFKGKVLISCEFGWSRPRPRFPQPTKPACQPFGVLHWLSMAQADAVDFGFSHRSPLTTLNTHLKWVKPSFLGGFEVQPLWMKWVWNPLMSAFEPYSSDFVTTLMPLARSLFRVCPLLLADVVLFGGCQVCFASSSLISIVEAEKERWGALPGIFGWRLQSLVRLH